ncbi:MAG: EamA family transporter [Raoultibacter sp.]|jgi:drug/metabolite transporter (DMT)-like permease
MTRRRAELLLISIAIAWGFSWIFMKMGLEGLDPFNIVFLRFAIAFVVVVA